MKNLTHRLFWISLILMLTLSACNLPVNGKLAPSATPLPTATPIPAAALPPAGQAGDACLIGVWTINDLESYIRAALPAEMTGGTFKLNSIEGGGFSYQFSPDGRATASANQFKINADVQFKGQNLSVQILIDGAALSTYSSDPATGVLSLSNIDASGLKATVYTAGIPIMKDLSVPSLFSADPQAANSSTNYTCSGNALTLTFSTNGSDQRQIVLQRVQ